jgi:hypothetical protein
MTGVDAEELEDSDVGRNVDTIKALFVYGIASAVVIGGGIMLFISRGDPGISDLQVVVAGFIGSSLTFVYGQEVQTRTARQSSAQVASGRASEASAIKATEDNRPIDITR